MSTLETTRCMETSRLILVRLFGYTLLLGANLLTQALRPLSIHRRHWASALTVDTSCTNEHSLASRMTSHEQQRPTSCGLAGKLAGLDKKLCRSLEQEVQTGSSPLELSRSPVGPLSESQRWPLSSAVSILPYSC